MLTLHKDADELSLNELRRIMDTVPPEENPAVHAYRSALFSFVGSTV